MKLTAIPNCDENAVVTEHFKRKPRGSGEEYGVYHATDPGTQASHMLYATAR